MTLVVMCARLSEGSKNFEILLLKVEQNTHFTGEVVALTPGDHNLFHKRPAQERQQHAS